MGDRKFRSHAKTGSLDAGSQFAVAGKNNVVILKLIVPPSVRKFDTLIAMARRQAKQEKMKRRDIGATIAKARE